MREKYNDKGILPSSIASFWYEDRKCINEALRNVLQQWLGHSSVFTTSIYTQITGMDTSEFMGRVR